MIFSVLLLVVLAICIGFLYPEGIWSNTLRLVNLVFAGLLAMNFYEPLAAWLVEIFPSLASMLDFVAIWAIFTLALCGLRLITDRVSQVSVRFLTRIDRIGSGILATLIGWVMGLLRVDHAALGSLGPDVPLRRVSAQGEHVFRNVGPGPPVACLHADDV